MNKIITLENAQAWNAEQDKFVFCLLLLNASANDAWIDDRVEKLETAFESLLQVQKNIDFYGREISRYKNRMARLEKADPEDLEIGWVQDLVNALEADQFELEYQLGEMLAQS